MTSRLPCWNDKMDAVRIKLVASGIIVLLVMVAVPVLGFTTASSDPKQGMIIDFGYWDVVWNEMSFTEDMDGYDALQEACRMLGYGCVILDDGTVYSINDQVNLVGISWGMYVLSEGGWTETDPATLAASEHDVLCWARASGAGTVIPGVDATGFTYFSYGQETAGDREGPSIVTLAPSVTEILAFVGASNLIVGTDLYSDYPLDIAEGRDDGRITVIGGYTDPNYEWIMKLAPDIVFCDGGTGEHVIMAEKLRRSGIDCVVLYEGTDIGTLYDNIWIAASAVGMPGNANAGIRELRASMDAVSGIAGITNRKVFVALSTASSPWTAGSDTFISDVIANAGGRGAFDSQSSSWFMVSKEQIYAKQPDIMIIMSEIQVSTDDDYRKVLDALDPTWKATPAYLNGDVFVFSGEANDILSRPGPRLAEAAELIAKILNPEGFRLLDPMDVVPMFFDDTYRDYLKYSGGISA